MRLTETCERLRPGVPQTIERGGRVYRHQMWYEDNFDLSDQGVRVRRGEGLPHIIHKGHPYINLQDWFDFHSGVIGDPPKKFGWKKDAKKICARSGDDDQ